MFKWNFPYFYLCLLPLVFSLSTAEKSLPLSFSLLHQLFINIDKIPMSLLFQRLNSPGSLTLSSYERCVNPWPYSWLCSRLDIYLCPSLSFTEEPRTGPSTPHMLLQRLLQTPDQFFLVYKYEVQQNASLGPWSSVSGSNHHCTPETSYVACALLCCPFSRYRGGLIPHEDRGLWTWCFY